MTTIRTTNRYTGRVAEWEVLRETKNTILVLRPDWATKVMVLRLQPSSGIYANNYAGETYRR